MHISNCYRITTARPCMHGRSTSKHTISHILGLLVLFVSFGGRKAAMDEHVAPMAEHLTLMTEHGTPMWPGWKGKGLFLLSCLRDLAR